MSYFPSFRSDAGRWLLSVAFLLAGVPVQSLKGDFAKGADVGWLSEMEASNYRFYDRSGVERDLLATLQSYSVDSIRLRVWVNPAGGWCGKADVVNQAVRAKNRGMRIMIDFHYSDWWADPGKQNKPAAWANYAFSQLLTAVYDHTYDVLNTLKENGVHPEWVQVGNEIRGGMLWPTGSTDNFGQLAQLINRGYDAVKAVNASTQVVVHCHNGFETDAFTWFFDLLKANGGKYDVIGLSHYPSPNDWQTKNSQIQTTMNTMVARYSKDVAVVEVGMPFDSPQASKDMLMDLIARTKAVAGGRGRGVFYWEPQAYNWRNYSLGAWARDGRPTIAMEAFGNPDQPTILAGPVSQTLAAGSTAVFSATATGVNLAWSWKRNGSAMASETGPTLTLNNVQAGDSGSYSVVVANSLGEVASAPAILGVTIPGKSSGSVAEVGANIAHPNGNVYDQFLLQGASGGLKADPGQVARLSYVDLNNDIVQVEFSGAGTLSLVLENASGPSIPVNYVQPSVSYMKGHAGIVIAGADETTNVSAFSVGRANAVNQALFRSEVVYDGLADIGFIAILSANGKFGGVRTANAHYFSAKGFTGLHAPGVQFTGPVFIGDVAASDDASPVMTFGSVGDARITGGSLFQANGRAIQISGLASLRFVAGTTSHGTPLPAQTNAGRFVQNGTDLTAQMLAGP